MAHLSYHNYPGWGETVRQDLHYSQAVRIGDRIECSGQGGWDPASHAIPSDLAEEIAQAFANVELAVKTAGGRGWSNVYRVRSYHVGLNDEALQLMVANLKKFCPDHAPTWTLLGINKLGIENMRVEIEVNALVDEK